MKLQRGPGSEPEAALSNDSAETGIGSYVWLETRLVEGEFSSSTCRLHQLRTAPSMQLLRIDFSSWRRPAGRQ